ncbi:AraC family transcriptional regulator [Clostridium sediminicola]|uniref:AraC family transcriptional regulator n=1 Tax=Clostridium sediminicola TaxID=3114879 RepID=UPI0031F1D982
MSNTLFEFKSNEISKTNAKLRYASKSKYEDDWHSTMHLHPFTELFYVVHGSGHFKIEDKDFTVKENDLVIVNANVLHTESSKDSNPLEYIVLGIDGISLMIDGSADDSELTNSYSIHNYNKYKHEILFYLDNLLREVERKEEHYQSICQNLLEILILNVIRRTKSNLVLSSTKNINKECAYIKKYIDVHYASNLSLDSLATIAFMNKYYLVHEFKKYTGTSPIDYLIEKRISVSKMLLETTRYSMEQITEIIGFSSQSYFNQVFKKKVGTSPSKYRKSYGNNKKDN